MLVLGFLSIDQPVIAAVTTNDQGASDPASDPGFDGISVWMIPMAIVALVLFLRIPDWRLRKPRIPAPAFSSSAGLILFVAALMGGLLGTQIAMRGINAPEGGLAIWHRPSLVIGSYIRRNVSCPDSYSGGGPTGRPISWSRAVLRLSGTDHRVPMTWPWPLGFRAGVDDRPDIQRDRTWNACADQGGCHRSDHSRIIVSMVIVVTPIWEILRGSSRNRYVPSAGRRRVAVVAIVITNSFSTGVEPGDLRGLPALFVLSLGFGWIYVRTGRLTASIVMHAAFNAFNILVVIL